MYVYVNISIVVTTKQQNLTISGTVSQSALSTLLTSYRKQTLSCYLVKPNALSNVCFKMLVQNNNVFHSDYALLPSNINNSKQTTDVT